MVVEFNQLPPRRYNLWPGMMRAVGPGGLRKGANFEADQRQQKKFPRIGAMCEEVFPETVDLIPENDNLIQCFADFMKS
ncbi:hypothetical protein B9Z55_022519 [Caenorhabditis nigoni]|uniref:Uncharacterized protein n=1 Tax=Caenorhabditis nigoni TaxID=1611254 RepID=A0A2G5SKP4_9PELO|nr:hypothetical protein B9Z55_022519 [Caenorhabditis nigoni]